MELGLTLIGLGILVLIRNQVAYYLILDLIHEIRNFNRHLLNADSKDLLSYDLPWSYHAIMFDLTLWTKRQARSRYWRTVVVDDRTGTSR